MKRRKKTSGLRWILRFMLLWIISFLFITITLFVPSCSIIIKKSPQKFLEIGKKYFDKKDYKKSYNNYTKAIESNPNLFVAYWERALVDIKMDSLEKAIDDLTVYIESNPNRVNLAKAYNQRAEVMFKAGYKADGCSDLWSGCELNESNVPCEQFRLKCK